MTEWITATGEAEASSSTLADTSITRAPQAVVGNRNNLEVTGSGPVTANASVEYRARHEHTFDGTVMSTVKASHGGQIIGRSPNGNDIVTVGGMTTTINAAVNANLLVRNQDGTFSDMAKPAELKDPTAEAAAKVSAEEVDKAAPEGVSFGEAGDTAMQDLMNTQIPSNLFKTVDSVLHRGELDMQTVESMASAEGVEPHEMAKKLSTVWAGAHDAATDILYEAGIANEEAFEAFIASSPQNQQNMMEAARNFFVYHKTEGLNTMAEAYLPQMDKFDGENARQMLTEANYEFEDKPDGGLFVVINGSKVSWDVAVKQKVITFSKA